MSKGYADIVLEPFLARYEWIKYSYMLEIKYAKAGLKPWDAKIHSAASRNQKEWACLEITNYKIQITNKSQITNYKKNGSHLRVLEMLFKKGFPGCNLKVFAKKTKS